MPPAVFTDLFEKYIGKYFGEEEDVLKLKTIKGTHIGEKKITSRYDGGYIPYCFLTKKFNAGLSYLVKGDDHIQRDIKTAHVTYTLPLGNLNIECSIWYKLPNSPDWQSLE